MEYLLILLTVFFTTFGIAKLLRIRVYQSWRERIFIPLTLLVIGVAWDTYAVTRGHWTFNDEFLIGIYIGKLPLEEYVFIIVVPYLVLVVYHVFKRYL